MPTETVSSRRAAIVATCPLLLLAALVWHPYLAGRQPNVHALAHAVASEPTRWGVVHLATGVGSALLALAFIAIRNHLHESGETRWSNRGLPFVVVGSTLYAMLPALELAPLAAVESGGNPAAAQHALLDWFVPVLVLSAVTFGAGMVCFALSVLTSRVVEPGIDRLIAVALVVMAISRFVPFAAVHFYLQSIACCAALLPLAYAIWRLPRSANAATALAAKV